MRFDTVQVGICSGVSMLSDRNYTLMGQQPADNDPQRFMPEEPQVANPPQEPVVSDLPQEVTESYGTGVEPQPNLNAGGRTQGQRQENYNAVSSDLTGGDRDAAWSQAENTAEETVGGTAPTPDQNVVEDLGKAVGTQMRDRQNFYGTDQLNTRDDQRWELEPKSAEDYERRHGHPERQQP